MLAKNVRVVSEGGRLAMLGSEEAVAKFNAVGAPISHLYGDLPEQMAGLLAHYLATETARTEGKTMAIPTLIEHLELGATGSGEL